MPIRITTERLPNQGSQTNFVRPQIVGIVGSSLGEGVLVSDFPTNLTLSDGTKDTLTGYVVRGIQKVSLEENDTVNVFTPDVDYALELPNKIKWLNNPMNPPELEGSLTTGGTGIGTTAVNYAISVLDKNSEESLVSGVVTLQGSDSTTAHKLDWVKVPFASGYKIYDTTASGLITTISNGNTVTYTRTTNTFTPTSLPSTNKARRVPKTGTGTDSTYYATFTSVEYDYTVNSFTDLTQVEKKHGIGSDLTNVAMLGFQDVGVSEMYLCAVDGTTNYAYTQAIDKFANIEDVQYIVALKDSTSVQTYVVNHASTYSSDENQKERFGVASISSGVTEVGTESSPDTIRYWLASFGGEKRAIIPVANGNKLYRTFWQEVDGTITENKEVPNYFVSAGLAFEDSVVDDVATSSAYKFLRGFNFGSTGAPWNDKVEANKIEESGGTYIFSHNGRPRIYTDVTNDSSSTENQQRSVLSAEDELRRRLRSAVEIYIGKKITDGLLGAIYRKTRDVLSLMVQDVLVRNFKDIVVTQDDLVKTKVNIQFTYGAIYPLLQITFKYSFDLS